MSYYKEQDELKYYFESRWEGKSHIKDTGLEVQESEFPISKKNLVEKYKNLEDLLNEKWHPIATLGAAVNEDGLLTDHGVGHIAEVMHNAFKIIGKNIVRLNGYEIYLLLIAIHFHDLGNIYGREEHEQKIEQVIEELGNALPLDVVEKEFVVAIAKAHGGFSDKDRDTIRYVNVDKNCNGIAVRAKLLAAILRFADELSDDFTRTEYNGITIPYENEVYHAYSKCLEPVSFEGETISFHYRVPLEYTQKKVGKGKNEVYLYDEILNRLSKCMRELEYCRNYANGFINITTLNVKIEIKSDNLLRRIDDVSFRLSLRGYPSESQAGFNDFFDDLQNSKRIKYETGVELQQAMNRGGK